MARPPEGPGSSPKGVGRAGDPAVTGDLAVPVPPPARTPRSAPRGRTLGRGPGRRGAQGAWACAQLQVQRKLYRPGTGEGAAVWSLGGLGGPWPERSCGRSEPRHGHVVSRNGSRRVRRPAVGYQAVQPTRLVFTHSVFPSNCISNVQFLLALISLSI